MMNGPEKSDPSTVAAKPANNSEESDAESVERREGAEGNTNKHRVHRTLSRESMSSGLERVRERAKAEKKEKVTALLHHVDVDLLRAAFPWLKRDAAPGVDGLTWRQYGQSLEVNLVELHARVHRGAYRAQPPRRKFIPKGLERQDKRRGLWIHIQRYPEWRRAITRRQVIRHYNDDSDFALPSGNARCIDAANRSLCPKPYHAQNPDQYLV